jgi:hypothetical protein
MSVFASINTSWKNVRAGWLVGLTVILWLGQAGCGKSDSLPSLQVYEVKGKVLLPDGKPLSGGWIYFVSKGDLPVTPSGQISSDGTFSLVTGGSGEGAPAGDYKIRVEAPQLPTGPKAKKPAFPFKYTDEDSSGLVLTVRAEPNHLDPIRLK